MNSEELEQSLRSEFETYLSTRLVELRRDSTEFQTKIEAEFDEQRARFDEAFRAFSSRFDSQNEFDEGFRSTVAEHLRLARDEGARITADAMAEAEKLAPEPVPAEPARYDAIRDAVEDIVTKDSQSAILKALVAHAGKFAARGAFFIIKSEHFVGWKTFDVDGESSDAAIRDVHFATAADSILGAAAESGSSVEGSAGRYADDEKFLAPVGFSASGQSYAIPLNARGRGVAVLYADGGEDGAKVNLEALETIVRVAGLTVELLAASPTTQPSEPAATASDFHTVQQDDRQSYSYEDDKSIAESQPEPTPSFENSYTESAARENLKYDDGFSAEPAAESSFGYEPATKPEPPAVTYEPESPAPPAPDFAASEYNLPATESFQSNPFAAETPKSDESTRGEMVFDSGGSIEAAGFDPAPEYQPNAQFEPAISGFGTVSEPIKETSPHVPPTQPTRLSDRPVDLPIEVPDDERRIHNDARRFARLLVSEIRLYNEKKVNEGRESQDLYERLREAIDRSREMYDKRVQPPVASKFDYFHYELVNALADGDAARLGSGYPGSRV